MFIIFVLSLTKEKKQRPKYTQLKNELFIKRYETTNVNVGEWFAQATGQADAVSNATAARYVAWLVSCFFYIFFN